MSKGFNVSQYLDSPNYGAALVGGMQAGQGLRRGVLDERIARQKMQGAALEQQQQGKQQAALGEYLGGREGKAALGGVSMGDISSAQSALGTNIERGQDQEARQKEYMARGAYDILQAPADRQPQMHDDFIRRGIQEGFLPPEAEEEIGQFGEDDLVEMQGLVRAGRDFEDVVGAKSKAEGTSDIINAKYFASLSPQGKKDYIASKRATQEERLYGQGITVEDDVAAPITGFAGAKGAIAKGQQKGKTTGELEARLKLEPSVKESIEIAKQVGKEKGIAVAELDARIASFPRLLEVADKLSALGKKATYTKAGVIADATRRQLKLPVGGGAVARVDYISTIDNEILPLLKETFGAQFTENEGRSLKITLGDPDKSPEEKDAVLRSFIAAKIGKLESLGRQTGQAVDIPTRAGGDPRQVSVEMGLVEQPSKGRVGETARKEIGGKTYIQRDGKWFEQ